VKKITVFTSNQPRHLALLERLCDVAGDVFAVLECGTLFPGQVEGTYRRSDVMQRYFKEVVRAEAEVFGGPRFTPAGLRAMPVKHGDLARMSLDELAPALDADCFVVFGASYIKGPLVELLLARRAVNIHMGVCPAYRGHSCNFWALYDRRPELVGGTVHLLSKELDAGEVLFHCLPPADDADPFTLGMLAVRSAINGLAERIANGDLDRMPSVPQDNAKQLRYSRGAEFTDAVAEEYLSRALAPKEIGSALRGRDLSQFIRPYVSQEPLALVRP